MFNARALRSPKRIRLSTCTHRDNQHGALEQEVTGPYISLPLVTLDTTGLRVPEWVTSTVQVDLASSLFATSNCNQSVISLIVFRRLSGRTNQ